MYIKRAGVANVSFSFTTRMLRNIIGSVNAVEVFEDWLDGYLNFERRPEKDIFWLDTADYLCRRFGNPQNSAPAVHVAGSKGKGSVSRMISCILSEAGFRTGVYSSPHITDFRERISLPRSFFDERIYEDSVRELVPKIESIIPDNLPGGRPVTWFELVTLFAFLCFRRAQTDWNVIEVGLGGRLDATNIITPRISCITPIELEHTEFLGDTPELIAAEKAGIIKPGVPVVVAPQQSAGVREIFSRTATERRSPCVFVDEVTDYVDWEFSCGNGLPMMTVSLGGPLFSRPIRTELRLLGGMQAWNAAEAAVTVKTLFPGMDEAVIGRGLSEAALPGRFEIVRNVPGFPGIPALVLDGAHTVNSIRLTLDTADRLYGDNICLLFACAADKDIKDIAGLLAGRFRKFFITRPGGQKASDLAAETEAFRNENVSFISDPDYVRMTRTALGEADACGSVLLVTGSFYLVAEVKRIIAGISDDGSGDAP